MEEKEFQKVLESARELRAIREGEKEPGRLTRLEDIDVAGLRADFALSQSEFAALLGISKRTLQEWEQGRRAPRGPARALLHVARYHPEALTDSIRKSLLVLK